MPNYIIKTRDNRNLIIEADEVSVDRAQYVFRAQRDGVYVVVGFANVNEVLLVTEDGLDKADFYFSDHEIDEAFNRKYPNSTSVEATDDVCNDCRNEELFESREFFDAVFDLIQLWHEGPDELEEDAVATPELECWESPEGETEYGFHHAFRGFVNFGDDKKFAAQTIKDGIEDIAWCYLDLTGYTKKEIQ